jgi:tetratricopeptide (TPR) repeat protein
MNADNHKDLSKKFGVDVTPYTAVLDLDVEIVAKLPGYLNAKEYMSRIRRVQENFVKLNAALDASKAKPDDAKTTRELGDAYRLLQKFNKAKDAYKKVIDRADGFERAQARAGLLDVMLNTTSVDDKAGAASIDEFIKKMKEEDPNNKFETMDDAVSAEAQILFYKKDLEGGLAKAKTGYEKYPKSDKADVLLYTMAMIYFEMAKEEQATQTLKELVEKFPNTETGELGKQALEAIKK